MKRAWIILDDEPDPEEVKHEIVFTEPDHRYVWGKVVEIVYAPIEEGAPK